MIKSPLTPRRNLVNIFRVIVAGLLAPLAGSATASAALPLHQISATLYQTEHCLFIIDASIPWSNPTNAYNAIYTSSDASFPTLAGYYNTLQAQFPGTYFSVCYLANTGTSDVPNYIDRIYKASGINEPGTAGAAQSFATVDFCRYNLSSSALSTPVLAVYDHELGHAWGAQVFNDTLHPPYLSNGHWLPNSTVDCQLGAGFTTDGFITLNKLYGNPTDGFFWQKVDNLHSNDFEAFSEQTLYLMGLREKWPTAYVLNSPVYNADLTASASSVDTFDNTALVAKYGARNPDYTVSSKHFKLGFVYIARSAAEVNSVYQAVEQSANQFCNGENLDTTSYRFQTPFLCDSKFRASVDGLLSDLDGNATPTLAVASSYVTSTDGSAVVNFTAGDPDGPVPVVSLVPASNCVSISGNSIQLAGLPDGVHFFTLKAEDTGGKKAFGHFVVEVHRPASGIVIAGQTNLQTVTAGNPVAFMVGAMGGATYQWYRQAAKQSTWNSLSDGGAYSGSTTATLTVTSAVAMNGDQFICLVGNGGAGVTSNAAMLVVNETVPTLSTQPVDRSAASGNTVAFSVVAGGATTFGYYYYQWQRLAAGGGTWAALTDGSGYSGSATASLRIVTSLAMNGDQVRCVVSNTTGAVISNAANLVVGTVPVVTTQPTPVATSAGQGATFSVVVSGSGPLTYQWSLYSTPVPGGSGATLSLANVQAADAGAYSVFVTNAFGSTRSNVGSLTVAPAAPTITSPPQAASVAAGQAVTFSATASGTSPFTYQWKKNGVAIAGATGPTYTISHVTAADAGTYTVVTTNSVGSVTSSGAVLTVKCSLAHDFNGDGESDIVWTDALTGERAIWLMNDGILKGGASLGTAPVDWMISATGDFDGDGKADILLTNTITGDRVLWLMNGTTIGSNLYLGNVPVQWIVSAVGDFDGDGKADIFWSNTVTGDRAVWLMNGGTISAAGYLGNVPAEWIVSGTGDFDGDGRSDIVWTDTMTGDRAVWLMNGLALSGGGSLGNVPVDWTISGSGDFDGDGKADILLSNTATGDRAIWLMNGTLISSNLYIGNISVDWAVGTVGDFNGDGKTDIFWTNTSTGDRAVWLMNGGTLTEGEYLGNVPVEWHPAK